MWKKKSNNRMHCVHELWRELSHTKKTENEMEHFHFEDERRKTFSRSQTCNAHYTFDCNGIFDLISCWWHWSYKHQQYNKIFILTANNWKQNIVEMYWNNQWSRNKARMMSILNCIYCNGIEKNPSRFIWLWNPYKIEMDLKL